MAPRSFWKGYLKLSLVTCPVAMMPVVTEREKIRFHVLNRDTGHRVESIYVDAVTGEEVADEAQVRGYPQGEDEYIPIEDEELDAVALESTRTIDIGQFVPEASIDWIWYDRPHYLVPDDTVAQEAFAVIREAMAATGTVGISRLVLYRRERAVLLKPRHRGILLWTLRFGDEVRDEKDYFAEIGTGKPDTKLLQMAKQVILERTKPWRPQQLDDPVEKSLVELVKSKQKGKRPTKPKKAQTPPRPNNVIDLMDALRKSLGGRPRRQR